MCISSGCLLALPLRVPCGSGKDAILCVMMYCTGSNHHNEDPPVLPYERCDSCPEQTPYGRHPVAGASSSPLLHKCIGLFHGSNAQRSIVWCRFESNTAWSAASFSANCMLHCDGKHTCHRWSQYLSHTTCIQMFLRRVHKLYVAHIVHKIQYACMMTCLADKHFIDKKPTPKQHSHAKQTR